MSRPVGCGPVAKLQAIRRVVSDKRLSKADIVTFVVIVDRMNLDGEAWPGLNTIAEDAAVDRSTAVRAVGCLVKYGHLEKTRGTHAKSNLYRLGRGSAMPSREPAPRCEDAPQVGASVRLAVGASARPESVSLNLNNETNRHFATENLSGSKTEAVTACRDKTRAETVEEQYTRLHDEKMHALYAERCGTEKG